MITYFCPACWGSVSGGAAVCPRCHADLGVLDQRLFTEKLIAALRHPEPTTRTRAAFVLGERREPAAVEAFRPLLAAKREPFLATEIVTALGKIRGPEAQALLLQALDADAFIVRQAALRALVRWGEPTAGRALRRAARDASPSVRRLTRELGNEWSREPC